MRGSRLGAVIVAAAVAVAGSFALDAIPTDPAFRESRVGTYVVPFVIGGLRQVGGATLVVALALATLGRVSPARRERAGRRLAALGASVAVVVVASFVAGEAMLRIVYRDGITTSEHLGPLVRRFERDFRMNRFDGPSRGPETTGPKPAGAVRLLVQGDSITWGQGVRDEADVWTSRLLAAVRADRPDAGMAVLAKCGRETSGHVAALRRYGAEIDPDVVVYLWHPTDAEESARSRRPHVTMPWSKLFFHPLLKQLSYFWYYADFRAKSFLGSRLDTTYSDFLLQELASDTPTWDAFTAHFRDWAREATSLSPRVLVVLYPEVGADGFRLAPIHARAAALAASCGVAVLDLGDGGGFLGGDVRRTAASRYDPHPNAEVHGLMAARIEAELRARWPELFARAS